MFRLKHIWLVLWSLVGLNIILVVIIFLNSTGYTNFTDILSFIGTITTAFAFLIGCYFAVLAVSAYSHHRDIEKIKDEVVNERKNISLLRKEMVQITNELLELTFEFIDHQINKTYRKKPGIINVEMEDLHRKRREELYRRRALMAASHIELNHSKRIKLMRELGAFGNQSDIELMEKILNDKDEKEEIRKLAENILKSLAEKKSR